MTTQSRRLSPPCYAHARSVCICIGVILLFATQSFAETISTAYDSWQWNGFSRSTSQSSQTSSSTVTMSSALSASIETSVSAYSLAELTSSASSYTYGTSGTSCYYNWQYGGFSRSYSGTVSVVSTSLPQSSVTTSALSAALTVEAHDPTPNSLSGYVFFDENDNGKMNMTDWAILDAKIQLTNQDSGDTWHTYTNADGYYIFDDLASGTYSISLLTATTEPGTLILGQLYDIDGNPLADSGKTDADGFYDIVLDGGDYGINYGFCESEYPIDCISKRLLISGGPNHTVPEPATFALLAIAGLVLGTYSLRGKNRAA